jgi:carbonic anhydrase
LQPGDVFVHRNIANILTPTDLSSLSVIQYAVEYLKVKHIVVSGHTKCGGVAGAMGNKKLGLIDTWLLPLRALRRDHLKLLESLGPEEAALKLVELNVRAGVKILEENPVVIDAIVISTMSALGSSRSSTSRKTKRLFEAGKLLSRLKLDVLDGMSPFLVEYGC